MTPRMRIEKTGLVETSKVTQNQKDSESLRTKIPPGVKHILDLKADDVIEWEVVLREGSRVIEVRKRSGKESNKGR